MCARVRANVINRGEIEKAPGASDRRLRPHGAQHDRALRPNVLIVTPGDRDDVLLAACIAALNGVPLAGILLTSGIYPISA